MEHQGRHALVTGGGSGIGYEIAKDLAAAGAEVTITGRRTSLLKKIAERHERIHPLTMDVSDERSVRDGVEKAASDHGPVAICIANAGIAEGGPFAGVTLEDWRRVLTTNLDGAFLTIQAAMATLDRESWGRMIAISSIAGIRGLKGAIPYTVSKHGMIGLIRGLSEEYMGSKITFNAVCPGYVETDIVRNQIPAVASRMNISEDEAAQVFAKGNRHRVLLQADEISATTLWLCSDAARSINGQSIQIAGGQVA